MCAQVQPRARLELYPQQLLPVSDGATAHLGVRLIEDLLNKVGVGKRLAPVLLLLGLMAELLSSHVTVSDRAPVVARHSK